MIRALRVLHVASGDLWGGAEAQVFTLISQLARMPETEVAAVLMNEQTLANKLQSSGISTYVMDEERIHAFGIFWKLRGVLRKWQPDVIHTHRQKENILGALANRLCRNVPSVRTIHGASEHSGAAGWKGVRNRFLLECDAWCGSALQQRIIAVTEELAGKLTGRFPATKIVVIENGVDLEAVNRMKGVATFRLAEPDATHVGIAGRLVHVKRVDLFIEAAALLVRDRPDRRWSFHIFGEGPSRQRLEQLSERVRLGAKLTFHGHKEDIATYVSALDALVISSDHEGMPMIALEAAALGVPTVAHAVGGLIDVVPKEFQVFQHDAQGYRDGILRALGTDSRAIAVRHGTEAVARFSAQRNAERIRALYEELVAD